MSFSPPVSEDAPVSEVGFDLVSIQPFFESCRSQHRACLQFTCGSCVPNVWVAVGRKSIGLAPAPLACAGTEKRVPGNALEQAAKRKRLHTYPELAVARRCKLVVLALEVGGRFGREAVACLRQLARARARESSARLRPAVQRASLHRWTGMVAVAAQRALAYSLLELPLAAADECDGTEPPLGDLLADARDTEPVPASRLPAPC